MKNSYEINSVTIKNDGRVGVAFIGYFNSIESATVAAEKELENHLDSRTTILCHQDKKEIFKMSSDKIKQEMH